MQTINIAGYKFIPLNDLETLQAYFLALCSLHHLKGTILLSHEGINLSLAARVSDMQAFKTELLADARFVDMSFHETYSDTQPFKRLKVKIKNEIITLRQPDANPLQERAPSLAPEVFKQWLDENRDVIVLDTRNEYEVEYGTFKRAINLHINDFGEFPAAVENIDVDKPVVMFCTGGIRCEKAALYMQQQGHTNVYQLDGGILGYFAKVGGAHYEGKCFVFDERVAVDPALNATSVEGTDTNK